MILYMTPILFSSTSDFPDIKVFKDIFYIFFSKRKIKNKREGKKKKGEKRKEKERKVSEEKRNHHDYKNVMYVANTTKTVYCTCYQNKMLYNVLYSKFIHIVKDITHPKSDNVYLVV